MRYGYLVGTFDKILQTAFTPTDRCIHIPPQFLERPLFCETLNGIVNLEKSEKTDTMFATLRDASNLAGVLAEVTPHDFRRGAAFELAWIPDESVQRGVAGPGVSQALYHSAREADGGLTQRYAGDPPIDFWKLRVNFGKG